MQAISTSDDHSLDVSQVLIGSFGCKKKPSLQEYDTSLSNVYPLSNEMLLVTDFFPFSNKAPGPQSEN